MNSAYTKLKEIWSDCSQDDTSPLKNIIPRFSENNIRLRQGNSDLNQITLSVPTSKENSYVIGLRYLKEDGTFTEDHFLCERDGIGIKGKKIIHHPKLTLERALTEYKGTHKEIPDIKSVINSAMVTDVRTYSHFSDNYKNNL